MSPTITWLWLSLGNCVSSSWWIVNPASIFWFIELPKPYNNGLGMLRGCVWVSSSLFIPLALIWNGIPISIWSSQGEAFVLMENVGSKQTPTRWNIGIMERWNHGKASKYLTTSFHYSSIPALSYPCFASMLNKLLHLTWYAHIGASLLDPRFSVQYVIQKELSWLSIASSTMMARSSAFPIVLLRPGWWCIILLSVSAANVHFVLTYGVSHDGVL